jgi:hypothetical protein
MLPDPLICATWLSVQQSASLSLADDSPSKWRYELGYPDFKYRVFYNDTETCYLLRLIPMLCSEESNQLWQMQVSIDQAIGSLILEEQQQEQQQQQQQYKRQSTTDQQQLRISIRDGGTSSSWSGFMRSLGRQAAIVLVIVSLSTPHIIHALDFHTDAILGLRSMCVANVVSIGTVVVGTDRRVDCSLPANHGLVRCDLLDHQLA